MSRPLQRTSDGHYQLSLDEDERALLARLAPLMREVLADPDDPVLERLMPVAYPEDVDRQTEYRLLVQNELMESHVGALRVLEETAEADQLNEEQVLAWMRAINQVRLVMAERLAITEDVNERPTSPEDPRLPGFAIYAYLTDLQDDIVDELSTGPSSQDGS
jgi:bisphosphoglycerate-dependent phosphoglycerate mutase